ncbi:MAG TPA: hypothetical protein VME43_27285 [Bryobacteraceae bacterium]|nr:hypothetical protein [Bryobacteraceae bacterium]
MSDWKDLTLKVGIAIQEAETHLPQAGLDPTELHLVRQSLDLKFHQVNSIRLEYEKGSLSPEISAGDEHIHRQLWDQVVISLETVRTGPPGRSRFTPFENAVSNFLSAGPHGAGKGPRIGGLGKSGKAGG